MIPETVSIDELVFRVPGIDPDTAWQLAEQVAEILAEEVVHLPRLLPEGISLRLRIPGNVPPADLARQLAEQILEALR